MVGRKVFKTRLCELYQRGRCHRNNCSFAHGNTDIRRFDPLLRRPSFTGGRRDHEGRDLRETLGRRRSPVHRYSPVKDHRGRHSSHGGSSPRALAGKIDPKHQKKQIDGEGEFYRSQRSPGNGTPNDKRQGISDFRDVLDEQLTELQIEIDVLLGHKKQLELTIQECGEEVAGLTSEIEDLEGQLVKEKEDSKRISSKIKKFLKAYSRHSRLQDELKRSYAQLQKQVETLCSDVSGPGTNVEDLSNNISSDKECAGHIAKRGYDEQHKTSSSRKRVRLPHDSNKASNKVKRSASTHTELMAMSENHCQISCCYMSEVSGSSSVIGGDTIGDETRKVETRPGKLSHVDVHHAQPDKSKKLKLDDRKSGYRTLTSEDNKKRGNSPSKESRFSGLGLTLPSTSMAAHPVDEDEIVDANDKFDVQDDPALCENEVTDKVPSLSFLPPPPPRIPKNAIHSSRVMIERVDIDGIDEETADVDID